MKYQELKTKSESELKTLLAESREKLRDLSFKVRSNQLKNVREVRSAKKLIAQILYLISLVKKGNK